MKTPRTLPLLLLSLLCPTGLAVASTAFAQAGAETELAPLPDSPLRVRQWTALGADGREAQWQQISLDGESWSRAREARFTIKLNHGDFEPLAAWPEPAGDYDGELHIVQFITQPLEAYREVLRTEGASVHRFLAHNAQVVRMDAETRARVAALPFVRWVGPYLPEYRFEPELVAELESEAFAERRCTIQVLERGPAMKGRVAQRVRELGARIDAEIPDGFLFDATLTPEQLRTVASWDEVFYVDRWQAPESDMNLVREKGGANEIEADYGWTGQGVRAECMDGNVNEAHPDLQSNPVLFHGGHSGDASHGTPVTGVVFGDGTGDPNARGLLPDGQPIFADYGLLTNRYTHTAQLLNATWRAVFQTNSWGSGTTTTYTSTSMQMDDILFLNDIVITQSQSNTGSQLSRPQAWAKNIVAVGGIRHQNTLPIGDDSWSGGASIGPAADGRVKPDLHFWYDSIWTLDTVGYDNFCCTSAATPTVAGHFGLFFQMWHEDLFGTSPGGAEVFDSRPHATTSRAMMINNAWDYDFSGTNHDLTRTHQGWGRPALKRMNEMKDKTFVVDEADVLGNLQSKAYSLIVDPGEPQFRATMVYLDPAGTTSSSLHRINDLSLRATSPSGVQYWGNNGLLTGNWSTPGGSSNTIDVIENVRVQNPEAGVWQVEVFADELNQDAHTETGALDADFALVVTGVRQNTCVTPSNYCAGSVNSTGAGAFISYAGTPSVSTNNLVLSSFGCPAGQAGIFFYGGQAVDLPFGDGHLCVGSPFFRLPVLQTSIFGDVIYPLDITNPPGGGGQILSGSTWHFQFWYRDPFGPGGTGFNLSDGLAVTFCE